MSTYGFCHGSGARTAEKETGQCPEGKQKQMRYFEFIEKFLGADHPFGDLAMDILTDYNTSNDPEVMEVYESGFDEIYDYLVSIRASKDAINTFIESWAEYLKYEKEGYKDPVPFVVADQLREINRNLKDISYQLRRHNNFMETITDSMYSQDGESIPGLIDQMVFILSNCIERRKDNSGLERGHLRVTNTVSTNEQN